MSFSQENNVSYKLLIDGSIFKIPKEDLLSFFININIVSVYFYKEKRLYIWKGKNVSRNLQNQIPKIKEQILRLNPDISILRHFTIEGVKEETTEFLDLLKITKDDFKKQLVEWDNFRERMLSSIEILQNEIDEHYLNEEYREIRIKANDIIDIAEKIQDYDIISNQEKVIQQVLEKIGITEEEEPLEEEELLKEEEPLKEEELLKEEEPLKEEEKIIENESVIEENFVDEMESEDYNQLLRQANLTESRSPDETKQILKKCLAIITKDRENFIEKNPKRLKDEAILKKRI